MQHRTLFSTVLLLLTAGCAQNSAPRRAGARQSSTAPTPAIDLRYGTALSADPLTPQQLKEVLAEAREADGAANRDIWFVLVHSNVRIEGSARYSATVYFVPDKRSPRIRRGQCTTIGWNFPVAIERQIRQKLGTKRPLQEYVQVSPSSQPFDQTRTSLDETQLPFFPPENIPEPDLIAIIDAASRIRDAHPALRHEPVCRIETDDPNELRVVFGHQDGPLAGSGTYVTVHKTATGYKADKGIGGWVS